MPTLAVPWSGGGVCPETPQLTTIGGHWGNAGLVNVGEEAEGDPAIQASLLPLDEDSPSSPHLLLPGHISCKNTLVCMKIKPEICGREHPLNGEAITRPNNSGQLPKKYIVEMLEGLRRSPTVLQEATEHSIRAWR